MENISLRHATPQDADFLFQLYAATRQEEMAQTGWDTAQIEAFLHMQYTIRNRQYETQFASSQNWIIVYDTTAVGRHLIRPGEGLWDFLDLAILPAYQNRGIGTYAFSMHLQEAIQARAAVRLSVRINNRAKRLYERLGFVITEENGMYYWMEYR